MMNVCRPGAQDGQLVSAVGLCGGGPGHSGFRWSDVSAAMEGRRTPEQCRVRWVSHVQPAALGEDLKTTDNWTQLEVGLD